MKTLIKKSTGEYLSSDSADIIFYPQICYYTLSELQDNILAKYGVLIDISEIEIIEVFVLKKSDVKELLRSSMTELIENSGLKIQKKAELAKKAREIIERKTK